MKTLQEYLAAGKSSINKCRLVIMGNEAADLDSMASSVAYAYLQQQVRPELQVLPLMAIPREDFVLRSEAVFVFKEAGIDLTDVVFMDEVDPGTVFGNAAIILVDHNRIAERLVQYSDKVTGILDHHRDEGLYPDASPRIITVIGSTASLVVSEFCQAGVRINEEIAILLGGTILLDTVNLSRKAGRVTDGDRKAAAEILPLCPLPQQEFFDLVQQAKFNVAGLNTNDLLRKDYKEWKLGSSRLGIGSALLPVSEWAAMDDKLPAGFEKFCAERNIDLLLSMNAYTNPGFQRDLLIYTASQEEHDRLYGYLQENGLELNVIDCPGQQQSGTGCLYCYSQGNLDISRKKLQPLLVDYLAG